MPSRKKQDNKKGAKPKKKEIKKAKPAVRKTKEQKPAKQKILRRKKILCHTCKLREKCFDYIHKDYPLVCMIYIKED